MWLHRHPHNNSLVVFIHGIFGNQWDTWRGFPDIIQTRVETDGILASYDFYSFAYPSQAFRQPPLVPYVVDALHQLLEQIGSKYQTVVLVGHSQGGLVAKLYVVGQLQTGAGATLKVDRIITLGTPHRGRRTLVPLLLLQQTPFLGAMLPFWQLAQLASTSENMKTLRDHWNSNLISRRPIGPMAGRKHLQSTSVMGAYDIWAGGRGAEGFALVDTRRFLADSHPGLSKPLSVEAALARLVIQELSDHERPTSIIESVKKIRISDQSKDQLITAYGGMAADAVAKERPELPRYGAVLKATTLLLDFLYGFETRPLRKLTFPEALMEYVRRHARINV